MDATSACFCTFVGTITVMFALFAVMDFRKDIRHRKDVNAIRKTHYEEERELGGRISEIRDEAIRRLAEVRQDYREEMDRLRERHRLDKEGAVNHARQEGYERGFREGVKEAGKGFRERAYAEMQDMVNDWMYGSNGEGS